MSEPTRRRATRCLVYLWAAAQCGRERDLDFTRRTPCAKGGNAQSTDVVNLAVSVVVAPSRLNGKLTCLQSISPWLLPSTGARDAWKNWSIACWR